MKDSSGYVTGDCTNIKKVHSHSKFCRMIDCISHVWIECGYRACDFRTLGLRCEEERRETHGGSEVCRARKARP